jgi:hypothetical protein
MRLKRPRHRCPKCKSNNIYKRISCPMYTEKSKQRGRHKIVEVIGSKVFFDLSKKYRCVACRNEFDVPIIE